MYHIKHAIHDNYHNDSTPPCAFRTHSVLLSARGYRGFLVSVLRTFHDSSAEQRGIRLNLCLPGHTPQVRANSDSMEILLNNLLDNAIRYTPANGEIRIAVSTLDVDRIILSVEDSGPGIPPDQYKQVLAPFQKADDGRKRGTGLGLAIVSRIAELHGGEPALNRSLLGGLLLSVSLPVAV